MKDFERIEQLLDANDKMEMAIYHEYERCLKRAEIAEKEDKPTVSGVFTCIAISLSNILLEKIGRKTKEELDKTI